MKNTPTYEKKKSLKKKSKQLMGQVCQQVPTTYHGGVATKLVLSLEGKRQVRLKGNSLFYKVWQYNFWLDAYNCSLVKHFDKHFTS